jgi:hypothetical protein
MVKLSRGEHQVRGAPRRQVRDQNRRWPKPMDLDSSHIAQGPGRLDCRPQARRNSRGRESDRSMVGEAPAHNEATGRGLYAPLIGGPPVGPPVRARIVPKRAMSEAETRTVSTGARRAVGRDGGFEAFVLIPYLSLLTRGTDIARDSSDSFSTKCRSIQAGAALARRVSQQAFEHGTGIRVTGVISARVPTGPNSMQGPLVLTR